ncbi:MAG TPA: DUF1080 domain-containing protein [Verrucomicrobiales bacterium]|nr:DUF1080 domain-containing protein [Verrucomicrobiales bacterium]
MKLISGVIVFVGVFVAVGMASHFGVHQKLGILVWPFEKEGENSKPTTGRVAVELRSVESEAETAVAQVSKLELAGKKEQALSTESEVELGAEEQTGDPPLITLFNGKDLGDWESTRYGGEGEVMVNEEGNLEFDFGAVMTGVNWNGEPPATSNYEISLDAMKLDGYDFFVALTFPVQDSHATFVVGGWGGGVVGISSVDDLNASENETMNIEGFLKDQWYRIRVRVTDDHLSAWIDEQQMVNLPLEGKKISLLPGDIELSVPIGIASFQTRAQYRNIQWRHLTEN